MWSLWKCWVWNSDLQKTKQWRPTHPFPLGRKVCRKRQKTLLHSSGDTSARTHYCLPRMMKWRLSVRDIDTLGWHIWYFYHETTLTLSLTWTLPLSGNKCCATTNVSNVMIQIGIEKGTSWASWTVLNGRLEPIQQPNKHSLPKGVHNCKLTEWQRHKCVQKKKKRVSNPPHRPYNSQIPAPIPDCQWSIAALHKLRVVVIVDSITALSFFGVLFCVWVVP